MTTAPEGQQAPTGGEQTLYRGNPCLLVHFGRISLALLLLIGWSVALYFIWKQGIENPTVRYLLLAVYLVPVAMLVSAWVSVKTKFYELTTERIKISCGIFSKRTDELELYRVKDATLMEPFLMRMFGSGHIDILTADPSTPQLRLEGVRTAKSVREQLRQSIENCRDRKRTRVTEME
jgi:uncharacterized membrane protein YdbT with pleckstrin-like domain